VAARRPTIIGEKTSTMNATGSIRFDAGRPVMSGLRRVVASALASCPTPRQFVIAADIVAEARAAVRALGPEMTVPLTE